MVNMIFWDFTFSFHWNQIPPLNRKSKASTSQPHTTTVPVHKIQFFFTIYIIRVHVPQLSPVDATSTLLLSSSCLEWNQTKTSHVFINYCPNAHDAYCTNSVHRMHRIKGAQRLRKLVLHWSRVGPSSLSANKEKKLNLTGQAYSEILKLRSAWIFASRTLSSWSYVLIHVEGGEAMCTLFFTTIYIQGVSRL